MHPATSYWPPTTSPGCSFGVNENGVPHLGQKPSARPARPPRDRPTFSPHLEQKRLSSGTSGLAMSTDCGSGTGADGTVVMPAPRCWIREVALTRRRVGRLRPARAEPMGELDSLVESAWENAGGADRMTSSRSAIVRRRDDATAAVRQSGRDAKLEHRD